MSAETHGLRCPACTQRNSVIIDVRHPDDDIAFVWRRRECRLCQYRWNTYESQIDPRRVVPIRRSSST